MGGEATQKPACGCLGLLVPVICSWVVGKKINRTKQQFRGDKPTFILLTVAQLSWGMPHAGANHAGANASDVYSPFNPESEQTMPIITLGWGIGLWMLASAIIIHYFSHLKVV